MKFTYHTEIEHYNTRFKFINGILVETLVCSSAIWNNIDTDPDTMPSNGCTTKKRTTKKRTTNECSKKSVNRAKKHLFDYVVANPDMDLFVTLTLDKTKIDRYDYKQIIKKLNQWADNRVRRNDLKYLLVPELHNDGAIHFHGFFNRNVKMTDSTKRYRDGRIIYNLPDWSYGFTTAIETDSNRERVANYICKYVTKQIDSGKIGGRWYLHGGDLQSPMYKYAYTFPSEIEGSYTEFEITDARLKFRLYKKGETESLHFQ